MKVRVLVRILVLEVLRWILGSRIIDGSDFPLSTHREVGRSIRLQPSLTHRFSPFSSCSCILLTAPGGDESTSS